jgi:hypothetical protein
MKKTLPLSAITLVAALTLAGCQAESQSPTPLDADSPTTSDIADAEAPSPDTVDQAVSELPEGIAAGSNEALAWEALMGPDGEFAASASYQAVLDQYGQVEPYATIKTAEDRHANALIRQLERYGIDVPDNPYTGAIEAPTDLETAAIAWAEGEIANVEMYDELLAQATDSHLIRVLENLRRASLESHLPAFEAAAANGGTLDPADMPRG